MLLKKKNPRKSWVFSSVEHKCSALHTLCLSSQKPNGIYSIWDLAYLQQREITDSSGLFGTAPIINWLHCYHVHEEHLQVGWFFSKQWHSHSILWHNSPGQMGLLACGSCCSQSCESNSSLSPTFPVCFGKEVALEGSLLFTHGSQGVVLVQVLMHKN